MIGPRPVDAARFGLGAVAMVRPDLLLRLTADAGGPWARRTVRVLGARYLVQSAGGTLLHRPWVPDADAAVDLVHAASMVGLAAVAPHYRRPALVSAGLATLFAALDRREQGR